ncbi:MAG: hypothetical protein A2Z64_05125 [Betaproteobacteria bacterium RIFCSPLOWO2_02_67_12]|nr:MAG: hypothetical protein A2Z64_05125 [Betaproteobacteria bacterium RIFCSPLOWO2_02_67_12]OGA27674.1 MAG: hypothetical protein A3I65_11945 [Betaproteobacteria bacterium RIFCSPLOWO2_02_FULL_68_150]OGA69863.1 MAG: hypothetical protein A3F77_17595 [Betaproteobacteria bacterium RIFCSPLOWO2_12_FULL_67_28]
MTAGGAPPGRDAAWVVLETRSQPAELEAFCRELESLYRANPFLEFECWQQHAPGRFHAAFCNHSNGQRVVLDGEMRRESGLAWRIDFAAGAKQHTRFEIEPRPGGSRLTITDEYRVAQDGGATAAAEVDRSLHAWGVALKTLLERDRRWGWLPGYRSLVRKLWLPMKPAARRITFLVLVIGLADIALVALGLAIYWIESAR